MALCSESTGKRVARFSITSRVKISPAETRHSLLAKAIVAPRLTASSVGVSPAAPTIAAMTNSEGRAAASFKPSGPAAHSIAVPFNSVFSSIIEYV